MEMLASHKDTLFLGQEATSFYGTMETIPKDKIIEMPIMEDAQMGMSIGMSLKGYIPISLYTRMDFIILATNQIINHLDKIEKMSNDQYSPKVIIRTAIGETKPLYPGPQHTQDFTSLFINVLDNINVIKLTDSSMIIPEYEKALIGDKSTMLIEIRDLYNTP